MGYKSLFLLGALLWNAPAMVLATETNLISQTIQSQDFWTQAQPLVQEQLYLVENLNQAFESPAFSEVEGVRAKLFLHLGKVDRFLESQYPIAEYICEGEVPLRTSGLNQSQQQVYCGLSRSLQQLQPLVSVLDRRLPMLAGLENDVLPENRDSMGVIGIRSEVPLALDEPVKSPVADQARIRMQPAIAPPEQGILALQNARETLLSMLLAFPSSVEFYDPVENREVQVRANYDLSPRETQPYLTFLTQPNTGITRILPTQVYLNDLYTTRNRLNPGISERFPFAALAAPQGAFTPHLTLQIDNGNFIIPMSSLNYGFIVNAGDVPLESLNVELNRVSNLSEVQRDFLLNYRPPQQLEEIQADRRRFLYQKAGLEQNPSLILPVSAQVPAQLNQTYLMRIMQYQLPQPVLTNSPIPRAQRRNLDDILETPSSDLLVAFRPVRSGADGSYTLLWKVLGEFPDPQITGLEEYIKLE